MRTKIHLLFFFLLFLYFDITAQVTIDGEFRPRSEFRNGYKKPLSDTLNPTLVTFQRTRLAFTYKSKILNAKITLQDARIWGESTTKTSSSKLEINEAWAEYLIASGFSATFGRQILKYDDQRLFSASNWSNTGVAHDLLLLKYKSAGNVQAHAGFAYNNSADVLYETSYTTSKMYKMMAFQWFSKSFENGLTASVLAIEEGLQNTSDYEVVYPRYTGGATINFLNDSSKFSFNLVGYYQAGSSSSYQELKAYLAAVKVGYKFYKSNLIFVGTDYYSGTKTDAKAGTSNTFDKLYGSNHAFNGNIDYWTSVPTSGLIDIYGGLSGKLSSKLSANLTWHTFSLAQDYEISNEKIDKNMGSELDLIFNYKVSKEIALQGGYCMYFDSEPTNKYFKLTDTDTRQAQWVYIMLTIKPNFFKTPTES